MHSHHAAFTVIATSLTVAVAGVCCGYLLSSASLGTGSADAREASAIVVGLGLSLLAIWLAGPIAQD